MFASDLYLLTGMTCGTIEVVFRTGLRGIIFSMEAKPLEKKVDNQISHTIANHSRNYRSILCLAENIYSLCQGSFRVSETPDRISVLKNA